MKRQLLSLLVFFATMTGKAQTIGEAFYVYRSDGMINTFFRSEVDSMAYSYYDIDSTYYDEVVTQVIYTPDSIYRFYLAEIDSIGFVTPETKYQPGVVKLEGTIRDYIIGSDSLTVFFRSDTPSGILPRVGDKLVTTEMSDVFPCGFLGQVESKEQKEDAIAIHCIAIGLEEAFEYLYYTTNIEPQGSSNRMRAKDWSEPYVPEPFVFSFTSFLNAAIKPVNCPLKFSPQFDVSIAPAFRGKGSVIVHPLRGVVVSLDIRNKTIFTEDLKATGELEASHDFTPGIIPVFSIVPFVWVYGEYGALVKANGKLSLEQHGNQSLEFDTHYEASYSPMLLIPISKLTISNVDLTTEHSGKFMFDGFVAGGIYGEIGVALATKKLLSSCFRFEAGMKLGGEVMLYDSDGESSLNSTSTYERLHSGELYVKPFCKVGLEAQLLKFGKGDIKVFEKDWDLYNWKLVPDFSNTLLTRKKGSPSTLTAFTTASGSTLFPCTLSFRLFEEGRDEGMRGMVSHGYLGLQTEPETYNDSFYYQPLMKNYTVYPTVELFGIEMLASPSANCSDDIRPITLDLTDDDITESTATVWGKIEGHELLDGTERYGIGYYEVGDEAATVIDASTIYFNSRFYVDLENLKPNTTYKYYTYLIIDGEAYCDEEKEFTTTELEPYYVASDYDPTTISYTRTYYYDGMRKSRNGVKIEEAHSVPYNTRLVIFDSSFSNYYPKRFLFGNNTVTISKLLSIEHVDYLKTDSITSMYCMFANCESLTSLDLSNFNTFNVTNMRSMFYDCCSLTSLDLSNFNTSNVTEMRSMFYDCRSLTNLDLSSFKTSNVMNMDGMFYHCSSLTNLDLSNFNTSNVTDMHYMFCDCSSLTNLDLSSFNTSNVTDMYRMFYGCSSLTSLDFSNLNISNLTNYYRVFSDCSSLLSLDVRNIVLTNNGSIILFQDLKNLKYINLSNANTSKVTDMSKLFYGCSSLTSLDLSNFDTSNVTNMFRMFYGCSSLTSLDLSSFDTSNVTNMGEIFEQCNSLTDLDFRNLNTSCLASMGFSFPVTIKSLDLRNLVLTGSIGKFMFKNLKNLQQINLSNANTSKAIDMSGMFKGCSSLTNLDLKSFDTSNVTSFVAIDSNSYYGIFQGCSSLTSLDVSNFDTSNVTNMIKLFYGCSSLTSLDLSSFNTSNVTKMGGMFYGCSSLTNLELSNFDTSNVTGMSNMFKICSSLTILDLSSFITSNVTDMGYMFYGCSSLTSLDLSSFDTRNVNNMGFMFGDCSSITTLDLSSFGNYNHYYYSVITGYGMFNNCSSLRRIYAGNWITREANAAIGTAFDGCDNLVGGKGTKLGNNLYGYDNNGNPLYYYCYDSGFSAHIDEGKDWPGLFTQK